MFDKLKTVEKRYNVLNELLSDPKIIAQQSEFQKYAKEQSELTPIVNRFKDLKGEQHTLFIEDPDGNALEFKAFKNDTMIFDYLLDKIILIIIITS